MSESKLRKFSTDIAVHILKSTENIKGHCSLGKSLGSITYITKTANGYIGFDGNMRTVIMWTADGNYIGEADSEELFNAYYPWFCSSAMLSDGSILTIMTEERADRSATELVAFIVKGF